jgi:signal transduction histidine kinase
VLVADVAAEPRLPQALRQSGLSTLMLVPLRASGRQLGILCLARRPGCAFSLEEVALLASVADQVGLSIDSARLRHQATLLQERQRLSRELHDSVLQSLYGLSMQADVGAAQPEAATAQTFARIRDVARQVIREIRLFVFQLQPPELEDGLVAALHRRLAAVEGRAGLATWLMVEKHVPLPLPLHVGHALYHVAQEALNNILRHANAANVTLHLDYQAGQHILEILDDGCGFDPLAPGEGGMGLGNMRQRMEQIGGRLDITSAPGQGTRIAAVVRLGETEQAGRDRDG